MATQAPDADDGRGPVRDRLVPLAPAVLGGALACLSLTYLLDDRGTMAPLLGVASGTAGVGLVAAGAWLRGRRVHRLTARLALSACLLVAGLDALLQMRISHSGDRLADIMLVVAGSGAVLVARRWFLAVLSLLAGIWAASVASGPAALRPLSAVAMAVALVTAAGVRRARMDAVREHEAMRARLADVAVDELTGLPNRCGLQLAGQHLVAIARRESGAVGCTFIGLGGLDDVARARDPQAARDLVAHIAASLRRSVRATDVVGRWRADQLVVVTHGAGAPMDVLQQRLARALEQDCPVPPEVWPRRLVLGRSVLQPWDEGGLLTLLGAAEADVYQRMGLPAPASSAAALAEADAADARREGAALAQFSSEVVTSAQAAAVQRAGQGTLSI